MDGQNNQQLNTKPGTITRFKSFLVQCGRVWHVLRKPTAEEYKAIAKISALGIAAIGLIGFIISDLIKFAL